MGNQLVLTGWGARSWSDWFSTSIRLGGSVIGDIDGQDDRLNPILKLYLSLTICLWMV
ncbi:MAG: hypothetical protein AAF716_03505 [Cyanobacteria bacterium P01_D01_bin.1]